MITQKLSPKKIGPLMGILVVLGIMLLVILAAAGMNLVNRRLANPVWGQLAVVALAGFVAYTLMRDWILEFQYTVNGGIFYIERLYGQRTKVLLQLPLNDILFVGDEKEAAAKWPGAKIMINATLSHPREPALPKTCFAYRKDGQVHLGMLMANEDIKGAMFDVEQRRRDAREKWG
jgi:hypothetical protein